MVIFFPSEFYHSFHIYKLTVISKELPLIIYYSELQFTLERQDKYLIVTFICHFSGIDHQVLPVV